MQLYLVWRFLFVNFQNNIPERLLFVSYMIRDNLHGMGHLDIEIQRDCEKIVYTSMYIIINIEFNQLISVSPNRHTVVGNL